MRRQIETSKQHPTSRASAAQQARDGFAYLLATLPDTQRAELRAWLDKNLNATPPQSLTGKAINYLAAEWPKLIRYLDDGRLEVSNVLCENAIRPFVVGRKAWLFSDTPAGAHASARLYSLVETAKAAGLDPFDYLKRVFTLLPQAVTLADVEALLPWNVVAEPTR